MSHQKDRDSTLSLDSESDQPKPPTPVYVPKKSSASILFFMFIYSNPFLLNPFKQTKKLNIKKKLNQTRHHALTVDVPRCQHCLVTLSNQIDQIDQINQLKFRMNLFVIIIIHCLFFCCQYNIDVVK